MNWAREIAENLRNDEDELLPANCLQAVEKAILAANHKGYEEGKNDGIRQMQDAVAGCLV